MMMKSFKFSEKSSSNIQIPAAQVEEEISKNLARTK